MNNIFLDTPGVRIRDTRKSLHLNQSDFAKEIGISQSHLSGIEADKDAPTDTILIAIAYRFSINKDWLKEGIGVKEMSTAPPPCPPEHREWVEKLIAVLDRGDPEVRGEIRGMLKAEYARIAREEGGGAKAHKKGA